MTEFTRRIYEVVKQIPKGRVASYGQVAQLAGNPRGARGVGFALHRNPEPGVIPCHRVVFQDGSTCTGYAFGGPEVQRRMLEERGRPLFAGRPRGYGRMPLAVSPLGPFCQAEKGGCLDTRLPGKNIRNINNSVNRAKKKIPAER